MRYFTSCELTSRSSSLETTDRFENDPRMETFTKFLSKICVSTTIHVSWPNLAKICHCEVAKKSYRIAYEKPGIGDTFEPPFCPHLTDCAQNFVNVVGPPPVHVYRLWFAGLIQKSEYNILLSNTSMQAITNSMSSWWCTVQAKPIQSAYASNKRCGFCLQDLRYRFRGIVGES